jgi:hypothetical protein
MTHPAKKLIFNPGPVVHFGGNLFVDVPVILQVGDAPIIETARGTNLDQFTTFSIYAPDGTKLAKVVGPQIHLTKEGEKADLVLTHPPLMTVCKLGKTTLFEVRREAAAAIAVTAELYAPGGVFVKANAEIPFGSFSPNGTQIGRIVMRNNRFVSCAIGILVSGDGRSVTIPVFRLPPK